MMPSNLEPDGMHTCCSGAVPSLSMITSFSSSLILCFSRRITALSSSSSLRLVNKMDRVLIGFPPKTRCMLEYRHSLCALSGMEALLYLAVFMMQATLCENLQVEMVSQMFCSSADRVAIMAVRQLPPACDTYIRTYMHTRLTLYVQF